MIFTLGPPCGQCTQKSTAEVSYRTSLLKVGQVISMTPKAALAIGQLGPEINNVPSSISYFA